jgi:hypothetical protein
MDLHKLQEEIKADVQRSEDVRRVLLDAFMFTGAEIGEGEHANDPLNATKLMAAEAGTRIFNVLYAVRNPKQGNTYSAMMDLIVNLNNNPFWVRHASNLMPILHTAMAAQADYAALLLEKADKPTITKDDEVRAECRLVGLEVFVMMAYLIDGPELSATTSLQMKRRLAPLLG